MVENQTKFPGNFETKIVYLWKRIFQEKERILLKDESITFDIVELWANEPEDNEAVEDHGEAEVGQGDLHDQRRANTVNLPEQF